MTNSLNRRPLRTSGVNHSTARTSPRARRHSGQALLVAVVLMVGAALLGSTFVFLLVCNSHSVWC